MSNQDSLWLKRTVSKWLFYILFNPYNWDSSLSTISPYMVTNICLPWEDKHCYSIRMPCLYIIQPLNLGHLTNNKILYKQEWLLSKYRLIARLLYTLNAKEEIELFHIGIQVQCTSIPCNCLSYHCSALVFIYACFSTEVKVDSE